MANTPFDPLSANPDTIVSYVKSLPREKLATNLIMAFLKMKQMQIHADLLTQRVNITTKIYEDKMLSLLEQETIKKYFDSINSKP